MRNGWLRKIPAVLAAAFLFFLSAQTVQAAGNTDKTPEIMPYGAAMEATSIARVRLGPSVDFPVAGVLEPGQAVNVCGRTADGWYEVVFGNGIGYVSGKLLMPIPVDEAMLAALEEQAEWVKAYQAQAAAQAQAEAKAQAAAKAQAQAAAQAQEAAAAQAQAQAAAAAQAQAEAQAQAAAKAQAQAATQTPAGGNVIFVGDSRVGQMGNAVGGSAAWSETVFAACYGGGVEWLSSRQAKADIDKFVTPGSVIILNYGVNDLSRHQDYIAVINRYNADWRSKGATVYFATVGPVGENQYGKRNWAVEYFNDQLLGRLDGSIGRIDLYQYLNLTGYTTLSDGLHYPADVYARIFQYLMQSIGRV